MPNLPPPEQHLFDTVAALIHLARQKVATTINLAMVHTYFEIGREIVEVEQLVVSLRKAPFAFRRL